MHIHSIHIKNYRSFRDSGVIQLSPKRTVIVGANNAGKSSILDCLSLVGGNRPHRTTKSVPYHGHAVVGQSTFRHVLHGSGRDVIAFAQRSKRTQFTLPSSIVDGHSSNRVMAVLGLETMDLLEVAIPPVDGICLGSRTPHSDSWYSFFVEAGEYSADGRGKPDGSLEKVLGETFRQRAVVRLKAERMSIGRGEVSKKKALEADGSNLASVLHELLSRNVLRFERVVEIARGILPSIRHLQVRVMDSKVVEIVVWPCDRDTMRDDLAVPLDACGSGVSQVLVMAYVLATADEPKTLIIDEPNSFLHPGALARLIELSRSPEHAHHQYIIATHSPEVVSAFEPDRIIRLELVEGETTVESMDPSLVDTQRRILRDVGARLSSVFGADRILWVEGPTEEQVFERLIRGRDPARLRGTRILHVLDTGSFNKKLVKQSVNLYKRLQDGAGLIPKGVGFIFDREELKTADIERLKDDLANVHFLERRMVESYLLHPGAIAACLDRHGERCTAADVESWLDDHADRLKGRGQREFSAGVDRTEDEARWVKHVHASRLLERLFSELSETRTAFQKPGDSVALAEWLIANKPEFLDPLANELMVALPAPEPLS